MLFRHRSRWSHGIIFGTLIRILYFTIVLALLFLGGVYLRAIFTNGLMPSYAEMAQAWAAIEAGARRNVGEHAVWAALGGLWWGAASHTLTDVTWSVLRKGSEIF
jgi:uncharacterized metal-binding protein